MVTATAGLILPSRRDDGGGDVGSKLCHDSSTRRAVIGLIIGLMGLISDYVKSESAGIEAPLS